MMIAGKANEKLSTRSAGRAGGSHGVDQAGGDLPGARTELLHPAGGERPASQLADPGMRRRVHAQHAFGDLAELDRALAGVVPANGGGTAEPCIPGH
jgi:hypothetical protein